jgi:hypothetical protein
VTLSLQLTAMLTRYLPETWRMIPYTDVPDVLDRPLVMVDVKSLSMGPTFGVLESGVHVYVLQPARSTAADNEHALDDSMPFVIDTLSRVESVTSVTATRGTFAEKFPVWDIDLTLYVPIIHTPDAAPEETE